MQQQSALQRKNGFGVVAFQNNKLSVSQKNPWNGGYHLGSISEGGGGNSNFEAPGGDSKSCEGIKPGTYGRDPKPTQPFKI